MCSLRSRRGPEATHGIGRQLNRAKPILKDSRQEIEIDSMEGLWNPEEATPEDNDLTVFLNYPDFKRLFAEEKATNSKAKTS